MLSYDQAEAGAPTDSAAERVCPLDGAALHPEQVAEFFVCSRCNEMLSADETVERATPETWAAYLLAGDTGTDPKDAPLKRLNATR